MLLDKNRSAILVIDLQPSFLGSIHEKERVLHRSKFLLECGRILGIPIHATEQYPERMGKTDAEVAEILDSSNAKTYGKMDFSSASCHEIVADFKAQGRDQIVLCGIESHICVNQTAQDLLQSGIKVFLAEDAISARTPDQHRIAMNRLCHLGVETIHTEQAAYEWMKTATDSLFRDILKIVKLFA